MNVKLYSDQLPAGNTVALAKAISKSTGIGATESMGLAKELFGNNYKADQAIELTLKESNAFAELAEMCCKCGIFIEVVDI